MRKWILRAVKFLAFLTLGFILLWLAFRKTDFSRVADDLRTANYLWIILSLIFGFIAYLCRARRWILLIRPLGHKPHFSSVYHALMTGYLANLALPRIGEVTRCVALGKKEKIPADQLFGTVIIERTIDFVSLLFIMITVLLTSGDEVVRFMNESIFIPLQEKVLSVFGFTWIIWAVLLAGFIVSIALLYNYRKSLRKIPVISRMFDIARGIINGLKSITALDRKWEFIILTVVIWLNYALMTWVVAFALENTSGVSFGQSFFLLVIGGLSMSAPVQSGFGVFHYAISRAMIILQHVSMEDGLAYALLTHESQVLFMVAAGTLSFYLISRKKNKEANTGT